MFCLRLWLLAVVLALAVHAQERMRREFVGSASLRALQTTYPGVTFTKTERGFLAEGDPQSVLAIKPEGMVGSEPEEQAFIAVPSYEDLTPIKEMLESLFTDLKFQNDSERHALVIWARASDLEALADLGIGPGSLAARAAYRDFRAAFERASSLELFAVSTRTRVEYEKGSRWFLYSRGGYRVRSSVILGESRRVQVLDAVWKGFAEGFGVALCFNPHHGLAAQVDGHTYELLICYECGNARALVDGRPVHFNLATSGSSRLVLDAALERE